MMVAAAGLSIVMVEPEMAVITAPGMMPGL